MILLSTDTFVVAATLSGNDDASRLAILLPGRLDTKDYLHITSHAVHLAQKEFLVVAIDPPGTWDSPGDLSHFTISRYRQVIAELIDHFGNRPTLLVGHSRGGATAMLESGNPAVIGLILINAVYRSPSPPDPTKIENGKLVDYRDLPPGNVPTIEQKRFDLPMNYFEDGLRHNPIMSLRQFAGPKLMIAAERDEYTTVTEVEMVLATLPSPHELILINTIHDYRFDPKAIEEVNAAIDRFINRYL